MFRLNHIWFPHTHLLTSGEGTFLFFFIVGDPQEAWSTWSSHSVDVRFLRKPFAKPPEDHHSVPLADHTAPGLPHTAGVRRVWGLSRRGAEHGQFTGEDIGTWWFLLGHSGTCWTQVAVIITPTKGLFRPIWPEKRARWKPDHHRVGRSCYSGHIAAI